MAKAGYPAVAGYTALRTRSSDQDESASAGKRAPNDQSGSGGMR